MTRLDGAVAGLLLLAACGGQPSATASTESACTVPSPCWMTAGGAKFEPTAQLKLATRGPKVSFGGNVAPSCDLDPGMGGQWNHVDHDLKLHFQGFNITDVFCDGVPTDSPDAPVNHIVSAGRGACRGSRG